MKRYVSLAVMGILAAILIINAISVLDPEEDYAIKEDGREPTKIYFMSSWAGVDSKSVIIESLIQDFNRSHTDIEVIDMSLAGEDFLYTLKTGFASNEPPDVFGLWPGSDLDLLIENGKVADLRQAFNDDASWADQFDDTVRNNFMNGQTLYSVPFEMIYEGLFVNKTLFDRYKVKIPETVDELYTAVRGMRNRGIVPIAFNATPEGSFIIQNLIVSSQGNIDKHVGVGDELVNVKMYDGSKQAMEILKELEMMGAFPKNYVVLDDYGRNQIFRNGKAAMIFQGSWFMDGQMTANSDIAFVPAPKINSGDPKRMIYGIGNGNFHISQKAFDDEKKREASLEFLKYLTSEESAKAFSALPGFISSLKASDEYISDLGLSGLEAVRTSDELSVPVDHVVDRTTWESDFVGRIILYLEDEITLDQFLEGVFEWESGVDE